MSAALDKARSAVRHARFDPRYVLAGLVLMMLSSLGGFALAGFAAQKADKLAEPVTMLCDRGGSTAADLGNSGACGAAQSATQLGPYIREIGVAGARGATGERGAAGADSTVPGRTGERGAGGTDGVDGISGTDGVDGRDGRDGVDGQDGAPGEPGTDGVDGQDGAPGADGAPGEPGADGPPGPPGPTCPSGTSLQPVRFEGGQEGLGCVNDSPPPENPESTQ